MAGERSPQVEPAALSQLVKDKAKQLGFHPVGIAPAGYSPDYQRFRSWLAAGYDGQMSYLARRADERATPTSILPEAQSVIVLGASYHVGDLPSSLRDDPSRGLIASYAWGADYHDLLKPLLFEIDATLRAATGREIRARAYVDTGPILERSWATQAGLGFIGKNTCLIAPQTPARMPGSWMCIAVLLVPEILAYDPPLRPRKPAPAEGDDKGYEGLAAVWSRPVLSGTTGHATGTCGRCARCLDVCPTAAFPQPYIVDARRCISYLTIELRGPIPRYLRPGMGNWVFGCDLCQLVCPWNSPHLRARRKPIPATHDGSRPVRLSPPGATPGRILNQLDPGQLFPQAIVDRAAPPLLELLQLDEAGFRQRFRGTPVMRAKRAGLLRNACVAAGNWGDQVAVPALVQALQDDEPLIRGHAAWALGKIGGHQAQEALVRRRAVEEDSYVLDEIKLAQSGRNRTTEN